MEGVAKLISLLSLVLIITSLAIIEFRNLRRAAYAYCIQALVMCAIFSTFASAGNPHLYWWAGVAFVTKVLIIPYLLIRYINRTTDVEVEPLFGYIVSIILVSVMMIIFYKLTHTYVSFIAPTEVATEEPFRTNLAVSFTIFFMGLYCIMARRDAIKTVHGLLILENGIHVSLVSLASGLRETALVGVVTDVVIAAYMLLYIIQGIFEKFGSTDTFQLKNLKW